MSGWSLDSWGNRSSHPVVCSRVWLGTKNFCLRTLWACSPQPLETHWEPFTILPPTNPAPLLPTARPQPHAAMLTGSHPIPQCSPLRVLSFAGTSGLSRALMPQSWPPWDRSQGPGRVSDSMPRPGMEASGSRALPAL